MDGRSHPRRRDAAAAVDPRLVAALAVQLEAWPARLRAGVVRVGWKLGVGDGERIGGELAVGRLTSATVLAPGASYSAGDAGDLRADVEVAFEIGPDPGSGDPAAVPTPRRRRRRPGAGRPRRAPGRPGAWSRPAWAPWGGWSCRSCPSWPAGRPAR